MFGGSFMLSSVEVLTVAISGAAVVGASVVGTVYVTGESRNSHAERPALVGAAYDLSDAFFTCRDQVSKAVPYRVRNLSVDSRSSRFDEVANNHVVFMDMEVIERPGSFHSKHNYSAKVTCNVAAASNEVVGFNVRRM